MDKVVRRLYRPAKANKNDGFVREQDVLLVPTNKKGNFVRGDGVDTVVFLIMLAGRIAQFRGHGHALRSGR